MIAISDGIIHPRTVMIHPGDTSPKLLAMVRPRWLGGFALDTPPWKIELLHSLWPAILISSLANFFDLGTGVLMRFPGGADETGRCMHSFVVIDTQHGEHNVKIEHV